MRNLCEVKKCGLGFNITDSTCLECMADARKNPPEDLDEIKKHKIRTLFTIEKDDVEPFLKEVKLLAGLYKIEICFY